MGKRKITETQVNKLHWSSGENSICISKRVLREGKNPTYKQSYILKPIANFDIPDYIPFTIITEIKTREWIGSGIQSDDRHCYTSWEVTYKKYDQELLSLFAESKIKELKQHNETTN